MLRDLLIILISFIVAFVLVTVQVAIYGQTSPRLNQLRPKLRSGIGLTELDDGNTRMFSIDDSIALTLTAVPAGPGPCASTGSIASDGTYLYLCTSAGWGRVKLEKSW
jgi:hypothetical protein